MDTQPSSDVNPFAKAPVSSGRPPSTDSTPVVRTEHEESLLTRMIEHQTAKIPSNVFLFASFCAAGVSLASEMAGNRRLSRFVGMWVSPLLTLGVYNKMVKLLGAR